MKKGPGAHLLLSMFKKAFRQKHQETDLQLQRQSQEGCACLEKEQGSCSAIREEPTQAGVLEFSKTPVGVLSSSSSPGSDVGQMPTMKGSRYCQHT